jgi:predicted negative regulator of RcsB-dependent stress response
MTIRQRSETEARAQGFDAKIEAAFDWLSARSLYVFAVLGTLLVAGAAVAGFYEVNKNRQDAAELALAQVEYGFAVAMGSPIEDFLVSVPFSEEQARRAREEALAHFEAVVLDHRRTRAARVASLRAAEMEVDLRRWSDAEARLAKLVAQLSGRDALRAVALRLLGFLQEQQGRFAEAGESYAGAAGVQAYPARAALWMAAGGSFARAGATERALAAFQQVLSLDPELAEREGIVERLSELAAEG